MRHFFSVHSAARVGNSDTRRHGPRDLPPWACPVEGREWVAPSVGSADDRTTPPRACSVPRGGKGRPRGASFSCTSVSVGAAWGASRRRSVAWRRQAGHPEGLGRRRGPRAARGAAPAPRGLDEAGVHSRLLHVLEGEGAGDALALAGELEVERARGAHGLRRGERRVRAAEGASRARGGVSLESLLASEHVRRSRAPSSSPRIDTRVVGRPAEFPGARRVREPQRAASCGSPRVRVGRTRERRLHDGSGGGRASERRRRRLLRGTKTRRHTPGAKSCQRLGRPRVDRRSTTRFRLRRRRRDEHPRAFASHSYSSSIDSLVYDDSPSPAPPSEGTAARLVLFPRPARARSVCRKRPVQPRLLPSSLPA